MKFAFASVAAILNQMNTIFIFILAALFLGEKATRRKIVAVVLAFIGAFLAAYPF
jgi:drug/metabolite transporter (DMT)-like permease